MMKLQKMTKMEKLSEVKPILTKEEFELFQKFIEENSGIYLDESKNESLTVSLLTRVLEKGFKSYKEYYEFLAHHPRGELEFLEILNLITINETSFFRNVAQFAALKEHVLPEIIKRKKNNKTIRIWSAGCSSGEEPYSIAMTLLSALDFLEGWNPEILGTDVCKEALDLAEKGVYSKKSVSLVDQKHLAKYFKKNAQNKYELSDSIKRIVKLKLHNLTEDSYPFPGLPGWDVIFCRNVTIYFSPESLQKVLKNFYRSLNDGGYLFLGHAEIINRISSEFIPIEVGNTFVYKKEVAETKSQKKEARKTRVAAKTEGAERHSVIHNAKEPLTPEENSEESLNGFYEKALTYYDNDEFEKALEQLKKIIETGPKNPRAYLLKGKIYANQEKHGKAIEACLKAVEVNPLLASAHYLLGVLYNKQKKQGAAVDEFKKAVYADRNFTLAYFNLANIYRSQGKERQAARQYNNVILSLGGGKSSEWQEFLGEYTSEFLVKFCKRSLGEIDNHKTGPKTK